MPRAVHELISPYLAASVGSALGCAFGSDVGSDFEDCDYFDVELA